jgi:glutathione synthase
VLNYPKLTAPMIVTRESTRLREFLAAQGGEMVVKPLDAAGGFGVFHVRQGDPNTGSILEQATNLGRRWTVAQKYLPEVRQGDKRILLVDGEPLCAVLRVPAPDDARGNLHVGARPMATTLDDRDRVIVDALAPSLRQQGFFFVGLDVIGGWLTEINVTSPTGILEANTLYNQHFETQVVVRLEEKIGKLSAR